MPHNHFFFLRFFGLMSKMLTFLIQAMDMHLISLPTGYSIYTYYPVEMKGFRKTEIFIIITLYICHYIKIR